jgi:thiol-disulfide isomerase/thioredoxin
MEAFIARITAEGPSANRPPHIALEEVMRASIVPVVALALFAGGCDRQSPAGGQGNASAGVPADDIANTVSPDEAPSSGAPIAESGAGTRAVPIGGDFDRSHAGQAAPAFSFQDADGKTVTLAAFRGKPVVVNLWATWCAPCIKELPTLDTLATREAGRIAVVALSQDARAEKVAPFFAARGFRTLKAYTDGKMAWVPGVTANLPTTIVYDSAGKEAFRTLGDLDWAGEFAAKALAGVK